MSDPTFPLFHRGPCPGCGRNHTEGRQMSERQKLAMSSPLLNGDDSIIPLRGISTWRGLIIVTILAVDN